jgi:hypothetical protein
MEYIKTNNRVQTQREFFDFLSLGKTIEIRIISDKHGEKFSDFDLISSMGKHLGCATRFNSFYVHDRDTFVKVLNTPFNGQTFATDYNCYAGANPRRMIWMKSKYNKEDYKSYFGGLLGVGRFQTLLCDIEHIHREGNASAEMIEECRKAAEYVLLLSKCKDYYILNSGHGVHLYMRLEMPIDMPEPLKEDKTYDINNVTYRTFLKTYEYLLMSLNKEMRVVYPGIKIDEGAKDISRVGRIPGTYNQKPNKERREVCVINRGYGIGIPATTIEGAMRVCHLKTKIDIQKPQNNRKVSVANLWEEPVVKLLLSRKLPSTLSRNHYLEFQLSRLIRDSGIQMDDIRDLEMEINRVQEKNCSIDPKYLKDLAPFTPEVVNAWCYGNKIDLVYPVKMEKIVVDKCVLTDADVEYLETQEDKTGIEFPQNTTYGDIKAIIYRLCQTHSRMQVYLMLKNNFKSDWEYWKRNKLAQQLLNKTKGI